MALEHFIRKERVVKIGGCRMFKWLGGHFYTIAPISVLKWTGFFPFIKNANFELETLEEIIKYMPTPFLRSILPLLVEDNIRDKDIDNATRKQILVVWQAFKICNDLEYILNYYKAKMATSKLEEGLNIEDIAVYLSQAFNGAVMPDAFLKLPIQYFIGIFDSLERLENYRKWQDPEAQSLSEQEKENLFNSIKGLGFGVTNGN